MAKKKKVRVALNKNRQKRTRANDLTRSYEGQGQGQAAGRRSRPRPSGYGPGASFRGIARSSRRSAARWPGRRATPPPEAAARRAVDASTCLPGRVIRIHGLLSIVQTDDGQAFPCHVRRLLKSLAIEGRNVVTVGDRVWFRPAGPAAARG